MARYLAYIVNGGLLCSQFTFKTLIEMVKKVHESSDRKKITDEIAYLVHIRKIGHQYDRKHSKSLGHQIHLLLNNYVQYEYNYKVLVVLIDYEYVRDFVYDSNPYDYPKFLVGILEKSDRGLLRESCCRRLIKYFDKLYQQ